MAVSPKNRGKHDLRSRTYRKRFLSGLLSVRDALLNMRMSDVLAEIPVGAEIKGHCWDFLGVIRSIFGVVLDCPTCTFDRWNG